MKRMFVLISCALSLYGSDPESTPSQPSPQSETTITPSDESTALQTQDGIDKEEFYKKAKIELLLPINHMNPENQRVNLGVSIPENFVPSCPMTHSLKTGFYRFAIPL